MEKDYAWYSSIETMGAVDGPGLRLVIFLQGCPMRCLFCHNPETIEFKEENKITVDEVVALYRKNESYYKKQGGITISGGDALAQPDFLLTLSKRLQAEKIHLTLDTAAGPYMGKNIDKVNEIAKNTNLFLVDIKHPDTKVCRELTGMGNENQYDLVEYLEATGTKYWIRHVYVPTFSDRNADDMYNLGKYMGRLKYMERFEILPYHDMMIPKYENLGLEFKLGHITPPTEKMIAKIMKEINRGVRDAKAE